MRGGDDDGGVKRSLVGSIILVKVASYRLCGKVAVAYSGTV